MLSFLVADFTINFWLFGKTVLRKLATKHLTLLWIMGSLKDTILFYTVELLVAELSNVYLI